MFDPISQALASYNLTIKTAIGVAIASVVLILVFSVKGCIDNKHIIEQQQKHIIVQNNIMQTKEDNIRDAIGDNNIVENRKIEVREKKLGTLIDFDKRVNCNFKNFNNIEYDC